MSQKQKKHRHDAVITLKKLGWSGYKIAEALEISRKRVSQILELYGKAVDKDKKINEQKGLTKDSGL